MREKQEEVALVASIVALITAVSVGFWVIGMEYIEKECIQSCLEKSAKNKS